jgi:acetyl esterase/lipase
MARRPASRLTALVASLAVVLAGCVGETTVTTTPDTSSTSTIPPTTSTTTTSTPSLSTTTTTGAAEEPSLKTADVRIPDGPGPFPAVVLVHGGGWVGGSPEYMAPLAEYLSSEGFLTVNSGYQLSLSTPGFPAAIEDISCAVAFAAIHPQSTGDVTVIGHSAGAHIGSLVALDADRYDDACQPPDRGTPARFVGLAGPYDVDRLGRLLVSFFGVERAADPELWASGNPLLLAGENPDLDVLLIHGEADGLVPLDFAQDFADSLEAAGVGVLVEVVGGAAHNDLTSPAIVGQLIVEWLRG